MNRDRADMMAGLLVAAAVAVGLLFTWDAYQRQQAIEEMDGMMGGSGMMGGMMGTTPDPLWYLVGTLVVGAVLGGGYLLLRPALDLDTESIETGKRSTSPQPAPTAGGSEVAGHERTEEASLEPHEKRADILKVLPDDERRVLEPVLAEPGITQIALRDRADFSKSKISQTVSELEKRGLLYREKQGRTYRVYPAEELDG